MDQPSLQQALHAATRSVHAQLNRAITTRMPSCLPPTASSPAPYYLGMIAFGEIFLAFERGITEVSTGQRDSVAAAAQTNGLRRTERLLQDLDRLSTRLSRLANGKSTSGCAAKIRDEAKSRMRLITHAIQQRPYLALAYQWTFYLALFNGGRHLQRILATAGPDFWLCEGEEIDVHQFWHFDAATESDPHADLLKLQFKSDFDEASKILTDVEREEVVQEAVRIFELCIELIGQLDQAMAGLALNESSHSSWKVWDSLRGTSTEFVSQWLTPLWTKVPLIQNVKEG